MIVVDTDVIASFWIKTARTPAVLRARRKDPAWIAPLLWRAEMRSVLRQHLLGATLGYGDCVWVYEKAEAMLRGAEYAVDAAAVLKLVEATRHSSYDCEFVALAMSQRARLVTGDAKVARLFPEVAVPLEDFAG